MAKRKPPPDGLTKEQRYEAKRVRTNKPIATRLTDAELTALDKARGEGTKREISRSAWILKVLRKALGFPTKE